ncbi:MAG: hypothetical protein IPF92_19310 [Myxococcales bacterium]|nr:hypothetical protein [Myxococcales bacterium]
MSPEEELYTQHVLARSGWGEGSVTRAALVKRWTRNDFDVAAWYRFKNRPDPKPKKLTVEGVDRLLAALVGHGLLTVDGETYRATEAAIVRFPKPPPPPPPIVNTKEITIWARVIPIRATP